MTVKELIKHLKKGDPKAEVGAFGHFGEFIPMTEEYFDFFKMGKNSQNVQEGNFLNVNVHRMSLEIGPEPD